MLWIQTLDRAAIWIDHVETSRLSDRFCRKFRLSSEAVAYCSIFLLCLRLPNDLTFVLGLCEPETEEGRGVHPGNYAHELHSATSDDADVEPDNSSDAMWSQGSEVGTSPASEPCGVPPWIEDP